MNIFVKKLWEEETGFQYSKIAEDAALKLSSSILNVDYWVDDTPGFNPKWDGKLGESYVEVKYSASQRSDKTIFIETNRGYGPPSALLLSRSDYYLMIHPGWSNDIGAVGKVKLFQTADLLNIMNDFEIVPHYDVKGFFMPNKYDRIKDIWLGDVRFNEKERSFDMSRFIKTNRYVNWELQKRKIKL
jgi:hypothetical protein